MSKDRKSPLDEVQEQIDLRLGGLLGELGSALTDALERLDANGESEVHHERTFDTGRGPFRASAGVRIRPLGGAAARPTGRATDKPINTNRRQPEPTPAQSPEPAPRSISATVLDNPDSWHLIAELPGIETSGITLNAEDDILTIAATGRGRAYHGTFSLPPEATQDALCVAMQNGIMEITFIKPKVPE